jgi:saccharopine dehydrogenase (NAD+, L-lysine-forming)
MLHSGRRLNRKVLAVPAFSFSKGTSTFAHLTGPEAGTLRIVQLGCGITGLVCAEHLANHPKVDELVLGDFNTEGAQALANRLKLDKISVEKVDCSDPKAIKRILKGCDIVVNSVPWDLMSEVQRQAAKTGTDYVDFCMTIEALHDFAPIDKMCKDAGITALTSNGLEPGISDTFAKFAANQLDSVEEAHVIDGDNGFIPGMEYWSTWSPVDWIEEVTIPAAVFKNGKIEYIPPLHEREVYNFPPPLGPLPVYKTVHDETFLIPRYIKGIKYSDFRIGIDDNFAAIARTVRKLGLHTKELVDVKGVKVRPLDLLAALMPRPSEIAGKIKGQGGTVVEMIGIKNGKRTKIRVWTYADHEEAYRKHRANATGFLVGTGGAIPTEMLVDGLIKEKGLLVPEQLDSQDFVTRLESKGLKVNVEITRL